MFNVSEAPTVESDADMRGRHDKESILYIDGGRKIQYQASGTILFDLHWTFFPFLASIKD
jgi:hypothetical protein